MEKTFLDVAREYKLCSYEVATLVRIHGIEPRRVGPAKLLSPDQVDQIRPDLERLRESKAENVA